MKFLIIVLPLLIAACIDLDDIDGKITALNGTWVGECLVVYRDGSPSNDYTINIYSFDNGNYTSNFTIFEDKDCSNEISKSNEELGVVSFVETVTTESGVVASKIQFDRISQDGIKPPTSESLLYIDNDSLYFGAFLDDLYVISFGQPYIKKQN